MASFPQVRDADEPELAVVSRSLTVIGSKPALRRGPNAVPNWSTRIPALDGLRGIAILMVLMRHSIFGLETNARLAIPFLKAGQLTWSGVDLFFVISGFLIGGILLDARNSSNYFKTFYIRRAYRIFPLYGAVTAFFLLHHLPIHFLQRILGDSSSLSIPWASYVTLTQNFWMVPLGWFGPPAMTATWSLAVGEQFYLTVPYLIRKIHSTKLLVVLIVIIVGAPLLRLLLHARLVNGDFACYVLMPCRADALCMGVLAALLVRNPKFWNRLVASRRSLYLITILLFVGVAYMTYRGYQPFAPPMNIIGYSWLALFYTGCLLIAVTRPRNTRGLLCSSWLTSLGTIAYCSYLIHFPLIHAGRRLAATFVHNSSNLSWLVGGLIGIGVTLLLASISWKFLEKPLLRRGHLYSY